jgi:hypothetical protein
MNFLTDPIAMRGRERLLISFGAIVFAVLGYRLFRFGISEGMGKLQAESSKEYKFSVLYKLRRIEALHST